MRLYRKELMLQLAVYTGGALCREEERGSGSRVGLKHSRRRCLVAYLVSLPQKLPAPRRKVAASCELTETTGQTEGGGLDLPSRPCRARRPWRRASWRIPAERQTLQGYLTYEKTHPPRTLP